MIKVVKNKGGFTVRSYNKSRKPINMFSGTKENCDIYYHWLKRGGCDKEGKPCDYLQLLNK